ncbi:hypothetical protein JVT61DRAFT_4045 [Boletus reticuloceps]|uniref:Uncharacterized protein n=1 Tax=Boletus reticuloceps TaxID=495285 RepID=A0A8I3A9A3_9AGAM|nr:hypothetical protein JVT61DRAFT_4045 [Boletus reticuloceps]
MPATDELFAFCKGYQRSSTELVVYSREVKQIVQIAYPTRFGRRIVPSGVHAFLRHCTVFWECFCGLESDDPIPACFIRIISGATVAHGAEVHCHYHRSRCGFRLNLSETRHTAQYVSDYDEFPPTGHGNIPDVVRLRTDFYRMIVQSPSGLARVVPFFPGYLGSPSAFYPGFGLPVLDTSFQLMITHPARSHTHRHSATFLRAKTALLGVSHTRRTSTGIAPLASTSANLAINTHSGDEDVPSSDEDSPRERSLLLALANGMGIRKIDAIGLLEECTSCGNSFMASRLRRHIRCEECSEGVSATAPTSSP